MALGLACSIHQLSWFLAVFLIAGLLLLRAGDSGVRAAVAVTGRYVAVAAAAFLLATMVTRRTLASWQQSGRQFVPPSISSSAAMIGMTLAAGTLAGGFFPDAVSYQRRAPEPSVLELRLAARAQRQADEREAAEIVQGQGQGAGAGPCGGATPSFAERQRLVGHVARSKQSR